ncbi:MAG: YdcF family protein [Bacteroidales bacterium]
MFFFLSKILGILTQPFIWILILLLIAWFTGRQRLRRWMLISAAILGFLFSNGFLLDQVTRLWEVKPKQEAELKGPYDYAVVMGGMTVLDRETDRIRFYQASDRLWQTVDLYKKGLVHGIILSGGSGSLLYPGDREMVYLGTYLRQLGIPDNAIRCDTLSRNTHESAMIVKRDFYEPGKKYLLVTSAWHMRRSLACFRQEGIPVSSFPADVTAPVKGRFNPARLLPSAGALAGWEMLMHEMVGYVVYDVMGYY